MDAQDTCWMMFSFSCTATNSPALFGHHIIFSPYPVFLWLLFPKKKPSALWIFSCNFRRAGMDGCTKCMLDDVHGSYLHSHHQSGLNRLFFTVFSISCAVLNHLLQKKNHLMFEYFPKLLTFLHNFRLTAMDVCMNHNLDDVQSLFLDSFWSIVLILQNLSLPEARNLSNSLLAINAINGVYS